MNKKLLILLFILSMCFYSIPVFAKEADTENILIAPPPTATENCGLLGDPNVDGSVAYYLQTAFNIIKYIGIVACVALTVVDGLKAVLNDDKDALKGLANKFMRRLIYVAVLFFSPLVINLLLKLIGAYGTCGIG